MRGKKLHRRRRAAVIVTRRNDDEIRGRDDVYPLSHRARRGDDVSPAIARDPPAVAVVEAVPRPVADAARHATRDQSDPVGLNDGAALPAALIENNDAELGHVAGP